MPTENRSSNTEVVSVPFQREDRYIVIKRGDLALMSPVDSDVVLSYLECAQSIMATWNCPVREYLVIEGDWPEFEPAWSAIEERMTGKPAQQHQGEPVALPARKHAIHADYSQNPLADGWNACLDEIAKLGPLYTHADPGEVAAAIKTLQGLGYTYQGAELWKPPLGHAPDFDLIDTLRAQLAERDALLTKMKGLFRVDDPFDLYDAVCSALSASAEPEVKP